MEDTGKIKKKKEEKERLDVLLVRRALTESRTKAQALIMAGRVFVSGVREDKPGSMFPVSAQIELHGEPMKYVSRGGFKLEKAVVAHSINLSDKICMDVGSSTGGFTDCMLQNGAAKVFAVDVGTNQLAWKLRQDARVVAMEQTNIRYVNPEIIGEAIDFVSIDVAFISLTLVLGPVHALMGEGAELVCLIKPQFEAGREKVGKKGVVREAAVHREVIAKVVDFAADLGFLLLHLDFSPIRGPEGNIEYLLHAKKSASHGQKGSGEEQRADVAAIHAQIAQVVEAAHSILNVG
jgi:23S rRNA (cytidine1920-2'-O)/16S rRNA (cytidine1409-2'-O)-methyltransferase